MRKVSRCVIIGLLCGVLTIYLVSFRPNTSVLFNDWRLRKGIIIKRPGLVEYNVQSSDGNNDLITSFITDPKNTSTPIVKKDGKPVILIWVPTYHKRGWELPQTETCGGGCELTEDKARFGESGAVVFYMKGFTRDVAVNLPKRDKQLYVWWCHESPWTVRNYYHHTLTQYNDFIHWTMYYARTSHVPGIFIPHTAVDWYLHRVGRAEESSIKELKATTNEEQFEAMFAQLMEAKVANRTAAWVGSDCHEVKGAVTRLKFVEGVRAAMPNLQLFGKCGSRELPLENLKFFDFLRTFKFYFAFENTLGCHDYVTEKFWYNSLYAGAVPVVWGTGKAEYEKVAPPGSFIHASDFGNDAAKLAEYLTSLDKDDEAYKQYFNWWKMPGFYPIYKLRDPPDPRDIPSNDPFDYEVNGFCNLCRRLNEARDGNVTQNGGGDVKAIPDLNKLFYGTENKECYS